MTDAHCHVSCGDPSVREFLIGRDFVGVHPWEVEDEGRWMADGMRERLAREPNLGVGEIGLDRLKSRTVSPQMRGVFETQLEMAFEFHRPVVLHGAKCWGQVVDAVRRRLPSASSRPPAFLFHGFSRSDGLIPDIVKLNGYISVGLAVLNDHAVNYRELVKRIPLERLLVETDRTPENAGTCPSIRAVLEKTAELRGISVSDFEILTDRNASTFLGR